MTAPALPALRYDPGDGDAFKEAIRQIPGYPAGEDLPIRAMLFEPGALARLPEMLALAGAEPARPLLVIMDTTPMRRGPDDLKPLVLASLQAAGWPAQSVTLEPDHTGQVHTGQVHTDWARIEGVRARLEPGAAVLALGSGTVCDVAKHACFTFDQASGAAPTPFVCFPTANSVSAYTSNMAPVFVDGVKRTLASRYPDVLVCDLETLRDAPAAMTAAGVGDLLAAFNSYADWYLAYRLGLDASYTEFAQTLMGPLEVIFMAHAPAIRAGTLEGMSVLAKLISLGGLAMSLSHATAPMSGYEHLVSHLLDLLAESAGRPLAQHGSQVALATRLTTSAYQYFLDSFEPSEVRPDACYPSPARMQAVVQARLGSLDPQGRAGAECWADYQQKLAVWHERRPLFESFLANWPAERAHLQGLVRPPQMVQQILEAVGAPLAFDQLDPPASAADVRFAFDNAPLIRRRLTLADLFIFLGWEPDLIWQAVSEHQ